MQAQFSFYTSVLLTLFKTLSIPHLFLSTQHASILKDTSILKENLIKVCTFQSPVQMILAFTLILSVLSSYIKAFHSYFL